MYKNLIILFITALSCQKNSDFHTSLNSYEGYVTIDYLKPRNSLQDSIRFSLHNITKEYSDYYSIDPNEAFNLKPRWLNLDGSLNLQLFSHGMSHYINPTGNHYGNCGTIAVMLVTWLASNDLYPEPIPKYNSMYTGLNINEFYSLNASSSSFESVAEQIIKPGDVFGLDFGDSSNRSDHVVAILKDYTHTIHYVDMQREEIISDISEISDVVNSQGDSFKLLVRKYVFDDLVDKGTVTSR